MLYMVIEHFHSGKQREIYMRFDKMGRQMPPGVNYINSWLNEEVTVCYQLMEVASLIKLNGWMEQWKDLVDFEVVPVISSDEAKRKIMAG